MQESPSFPPLAVPWDEVRLFLALYRARTMGEAAAALGVDTSTVSRRLAALEDALDIELFDRGRHGLRPTDAADRLLPGAELVAQGIAHFANAADGLEREVTGVVRLACPPDVADVLVAPALTALLAAHPGLRIDLRPGEATVDLTRREADLALRTVHPSHGDLIVKQAATVRWLPAAAATLAAALGPVDDLAALRWIGWGDRFRGAPQCLWVEARLGVEPVVQSDSLTTQIGVVRAGIGVALLPDASLTHHGLVPVELAGAARALAETLPTDALYLVTHRALRRVPRIAAVWTALDDALDALPTEPA